MNLKMLPKLFNFESPPKNNFFAPEWNYYIAEKNIDIDCKALSIFLKSKKKEILKLKPETDGYTGLGKNSITARHHAFNIFTFKHKELDKLKKEIIEFNKQLNKHFSLNYNKIYIKGWYNVLKKGQSIKAHSHNTTPDSYLGGHFCLQCKNTSTYYINPINQLNDPEVYKSENINGKLSLFQNCIPHYTDSCDSEIITIAFDLDLINKHTNQIKL